MRPLTIEQFNALDDHRQETDLKVVGHIPEYVTGSLYRTGPGGYQVLKDGQSKVTSHWFDGYTVTHKFDLSGGDTPRVRYSSYNQVDDLVEQVRKTGNREEITFGQKRDPCDGLFKKFKTMFAPSEPGKAHSANIGVTFRETTPAERASIGGNRKVMTLTTDNQFSKHFDAETLEPLGVTDQKALHPALKGPLSGAHAAHDPVNGDIFNYNLDLGPTHVYRVFRASPSSGKVDVLATIKGHDIRGSYIHSMSITENFVVLTIWPAFYQMLGISILWNRNLLDAIAPFNSSAKTTWVVIDRRHDRGIVKKFTTPGFFCFHTVNAWEEPSKSDPNSVDVLCELVEFEDLSILHKFYYENMTSDGTGVAQFDKQHPIATGLARYKLANVPMQGNAKPAVAERVMYHAAPDSGDLPRINPNFATKRHRYVWGITSRGLSSFIDCIVKTDTTLGGPGLIWERPKHTPGEAIFVPRPGGVEEDDGVVLSVILNGETGTSYLLCLDGKTMQELGRAEVGHPVGFGFHGTFVSDH